jgi:LmbE family N-acetylglucosaminyl deacetylase
MRRHPLLSVLLTAVLLTSVRIGAQETSRAPQPDERFKTDLLLLVAHPDDDMLAGGYLSRLVNEQHKRVAVAFMTSGDSGGNQAGPERAASLGLIRQIEGRRDLATLGIVNVWYLSGHDTAGQDPLRSLANWGHGRVLSEVVRIVRLTRPEVILTWLPMQVAGENHGDHQAASVVATEAFDLAGDPTAFPEQVASATETFEPLLENLRPWQPKKLYFMSDAIETHFMDGRGPSYSVTAISPITKKPYWNAAYEQLRAHVTQYRSVLEQLAATDDAGRARMLTAAAPGDALIDPWQLILGKSHVGGTPAGDVFEGVDAAPIAFVHPPGYRVEPAAVTRLALGGPWRYYRQFWQAHGLTVLASIDLHDIGPIAGGSEVHVPLVVTNRSSQPQTVTVTPTLPEGWKDASPLQATVAPESDLELQSVLVAAPASALTSATITYSIPGAPSVSVRVVLTPGGNPLPR